MNLNIDAIADQIIKYSTLLKNQLGEEEYELMTEGQLHRYLYLTEVAYMQKHNGEPLFEENYEAWGQGPRLDRSSFQYRFWGDKPILSKHENDKLPTDVMATIFAIVQTCGGIFFSDLYEFVKTTDEVYKQAFATGDFEHDRPGIITKKEMFNFYKTQPPILQSLQEFAKQKNSFYENFMTAKGSPQKADFIDKAYLHLFREAHPNDDPITYLIENNEQDSENTQ